MNSQDGAAAYQIPMRRVAKVSALDGDLHWSSMVTMVAFADYIVESGSSQESADDTTNDSSTDVVQASDPFSCIYELGSGEITLVDDMGGCGRILQAALAGTSDVSRCVHQIF